MLQEKKGFFQGLMNKCSRLIVSYCKLAIFHEKKNISSQYIMVKDNANQQVSASISPFQQEGGPKDSPEWVESVKNSTFGKVECQTLKIKALP
jgi:hypothetical protein